MRPVHLAFVASIFLSAFLLFLVQPLVTRMLLPVYGGSPMVWSVALVFFQGTLLAGTLYAHVSSTGVPGRLRAPIHVLVLALPLLLLPPFLAPEAAPAAGPPAPGLLWALAGLVAAPFFALSSNAPLVQHWWSSSPFPRARDPYWLYGASNLGSLAALVAYPFLVEPALGLRHQAAAWSWAYAAFAVLTGGIMVRTPFEPGRRRHPSTEQGIGRRSPGLKPSGPGRREGAGSGAGRRRTLWLVRSAVGSSLLLALTLRITTDLAPSPLLWVVPLALYLATFVLAFTLNDRLARAPLSAATVVALYAALGVVLARGRYRLELLVPVCLATLFLGALLCHRDLVVDRPGPDGLTAFYVWIAVGGVLGGALNALVAQVLFTDVSELPLTLVALALLVRAGPSRPGHPSGSRDAGTGLPPGAAGLSWKVGALAVLALGVALALAFGVALGPPAAALAVAGAAGWGWAAARRPSLHGAVVGVGAAAAVLGWGSGGDVIDQDRSFFGVVRVRQTDTALEMLHGSTLHGAQLLNPARRATPVGYYAPEGPLGSLVRSAPPGARVGVVGLGAGALAALSTPGQSFTFFEIDPLVERMARAHFTYLTDARARVRVVLEDGRRGLARTPPGSFHLLVVDAFSSDFVPIHLLTTQALDLYLDRLAPGGLLALHLSSRHADLRRVVKGYAASRDLPVLFSDHSPSGLGEAPEAARTRVALLARDAAVLEALSRSPLWARFAADVAAVVWTDDRADLLSVLR